ncbi:MAG: hypothetical protein AB7O88_22430 [Reyranellaceae bacterium]
MSTFMRGRALGAAVACAGLLSAAIAWAETRPPATPVGRNAPPPKGVKWEGPDFDAGKARTPGKGFYSLPEVGDEVLTVKGRRKGR